MCGAGAVAGTRHGDSAGSPAAAWSEQAGRLCMPGPAAGGPPPGVLRQPGTSALFTGIHAMAYGGLDLDPEDEA